ncbi:hypothetical protein Bbelb_406060 [Branchiostoma belcheri]|nr:hypothetical protein Bbelb_406060 [Branchiostoma belcheri]
MAFVNQSLPTSVQLAQVRDVFSLLAENFWLLFCVQITFPPLSPAALRRHGDGIRDGNITTTDIQAYKTQVTTSVSDSDTVGTARMLKLRWAARLDKVGSRWVMLGGTKPSSAWKQPEMRRNFEARCRNRLKETATQTMTFIG